MLLHTAAPIPIKPRLNVAIIIPCHNYGQYLKETLDSIIAQTAAPAEIIVVDDASEDNTRTIALAYTGHGVKYIKVDVHNVHQSRKAGFLESTADIICFLDADDKLPPRWLEFGFPHFEDNNVGLVYCDAQTFGTKSELLTYPSDGPADVMARTNFAVSCSLVRRQALTLADVFEYELDQTTSLDDWFMWRRIANYGWKMVKQSEKMLYRKHENNMLTPKSDRFREFYYEAATMQYETITLFIPLSGRLDIWNNHLSKYLERQKWPHSQCNLIFTNSSQNPHFSSTVKEWIAKCDYKDVRHIEMIADKDPQLAEKDRYNKTISAKVDQACCRIYNRLSHATETDYTWIIEDDIIPPDDAAEVLLRTFTHSTASCTGAYKSRFNNGYVIRKGNNYLKRPVDGGLQAIDDSGFGCLMVRSEYLRKHVFYIPKGQTWYDPAFFATIPKEFEKIVNWDCECQHLQQPSSA